MLHLRLKGRLPCGSGPPTTHHCVTAVKLSIPMTLDTVELLSVSAATSTHIVQGPTDLGGFFKPAAGCFPGCLGRHRHAARIIIIDAQHLLANTARNESGDSKQGSKPALP